MKPSGTPACERKRKELRVKKCHIVAICERGKTANELIQFTYILLLIIIFLLNYLFSSITFKYDLVSV